MGKKQPAPPAVPKQLSPALIKIIYVDIFFLLLPSLTCSLFTGRDVYHNIEPLDPEKLNVFRTVREITGEQPPGMQMQPNTSTFTDFPSVTGNHNSRFRTRRVRVCVCRLSCQPPTPTPPHLPPPHPLPLRPSTPQIHIR